MWSAQGKWVREGQAPQGVGMISSQLPARKETKWSRKKKEERVEGDEESQHAQSGHLREGFL
jgi:hypothetical protein